MTIIGFTIFSAVAVRRTNRELVAARHELAQPRGRRRAIAHRPRPPRHAGPQPVGHRAQERARGRLIDDEPARARREIGDVEHVARESLAAVRETIGGYPPTDAGRRARGRARGARRGGHRRSSSRPAPRTCRPASTRCSAWAVREGVTNIVRHSRAASRRDPDRPLGDAGRRRRSSDDGLGGRAFATGEPPATRSRRVGLVGLSRAGRRARRPVRGRPGRRRRLPSRRRSRRWPASRDPRSSSPRTSRSFAARSSPSSGLERDIEVVAEVGRGDEVVPGARGPPRRRPARHRDAGPRRAHRGGPAPDAPSELPRSDPDDLRPARAICAGRWRPARRGSSSRTRPRPQLAAAIRRVAAGGRVVDPALALDALAEGTNPLSAREREVLAASTETATIAEIASRLSLSEGTVRNHLSAAIQKVGARNRAEAARIAHEKGWLEPEIAR